MLNEHINFVLSMIDPSQDPPIRKDVHNLFTDFKNRIEKKDPLFNFGFFRISLRKFIEKNIEPLKDESQISRLLAFLCSVYEIQPIPSINHCPKGKKNSFHEFKKDQLVEINNLVFNGMKYLTNGKFKKVDIGIFYDMIEKHAHKDEILRQVIKKILHHYHLCLKTIRIDVEMLPDDITQALSAAMFYYLIAINSELALKKKLQHIEDYKVLLSANVTNQVNLGKMMLENNHFIKVDLSKIDCDELNDNKQLRPEFVDKLNESISFNNK